ncbi:MAG: hypothetical protein ACRDT6_01065 [Micromonosporaceae bacterium]
MYDTSPPVAVSDAAGYLQAGGGIDVPKADQAAELAGRLAEADRLTWSGDTAAALAVLESALAPPLSDVERYSVGEGLLRASNCRRGWKLYDLHPSRAVDRLRTVRRWDGQPCPLLIVLSEQGFGDAIQFLRFVPHVVVRANAVVVAVHDELFEVAAGSPVLRGCTVIRKSTARRTRWPAEARWERLMSIPARLRHPDPGVAGPYLLPPESPSVTIPSAPPGVLTIGVAWRATYRRGFPNRSFPSRLARVLLDPGNTRVITLHRTRDIRALPDGVEEFGIGNFADTAEVISQCDCVVTADTVTAHLAPALGVPTLICLLHRPDWRWGTPANATRWYAAADLIFQDGNRTWEPVLATAARRISEITAMSTTQAPGVVAADTRVR